ncbi:MAG: dihydropteroate synthase [Lachnospiraceae bacterium]|nr:dihydropteroate synthase [Lachnospiraceae bacterium]
MDISNFGDSKKTYIMGILNVTPDSFSDGGNFLSVDSALRQAEKMVSEGVDIIDVGGESTRPGYVPVDEKEEEARVVPVIRELRKYFNIPISVDTYKSAVAKRALDAGADIINDIWGFRQDPQMAGVVSEYGAMCVLMHNSDDTYYGDLVQDVARELGESVRIALSAGVRKDRIIIDPGIGFGKTYEQNIEIIRHLPDFTNMGYPVLVGASRKSVIWKTLGYKPSECDAATAAVSVMASQAGARFVRVHNVRMNADAIRMTERIIYGTGEK